MSVAKVIELTSTSEESFEDAINRGISRASKTLKNVEGAWIKEQKVAISDGRITAYRVNLLITFVLKGDDDDEDEGQMRRGAGGGGGGRRR